MRTLFEAGYTETARFPHNESRSHVSSSQPLLKTKPEPESLRENTAGGPCRQCSVRNQGTWLLPRSRLEGKFKFETSAARTASGG